MKIKSIVTLGTVLMLNAAVAQAAHIWEEGYWSKDANTPKFGSQELSLDLFGSYLNPEPKLVDLFDTSIRHGVWGGGAGLNYFFTREVGIGTDFNVSDFGANDWRVDYWVGDIYLRLPIGDTIAPYLVGSGRGMTPIWQWVYGGGVGVDIRFTPKIGIFSDARFLWAHEATSLDSLTIRAGLRLTF
jgi:hypothetical protein